MDEIKISSKEKEVKLFLEELKSILKKDDFNLDKDLIIIKSKKEMGEERYSTPYTMVDLNYSSEDIAECLQRLEIENYSETLIDKDDVYPPFLFVFGIEINGRQIYIKLKIKEKQSRYVLCLSFHYAKEQMSFPYMHEGKR